MMPTVNKNRLTFFESLTSSDVLILIAKVKLNVLKKVKVVYLSRSIRPNKHQKIKVSNLTQS